MKIGRKTEDSWQLAVGKKTEDGRSKTVGSWQLAVGKKTEEVLVGSELCASQPVGNQNIFLIIQMMNETTMLRRIIVVVKNSV